MINYLIPGLQSDKYLALYKNSIFHNTSLVPTNKLEQKLRLFIDPKSMEKSVTKRHDINILACAMFTTNCIRITDVNAITYNANHAVYLPEYLVYYFKINKLISRNKLRRYGF